MVVLALFCTLGLAQDKLEAISKPVPNSTAAAIAELFAAEGYQVTLGGKHVADFWFRKEVPTEGTVAGTLGVNFEQIEPGALIGLVQLHEEWEDYKAMSVQPGVYTLRYGILPADGNHMGVSIYRDFVMLSPVSSDTDAEAKYDFDGLVALSTEASGTNHPAVMAIFPIWDGVSEASLVKNEIDQPTLAIKLGSMELGLVVQGHGES